MKKLLLIITAIGIGLSAAQAEDATTYRSDTLIIELANNSKLIIYVDSQDDLKSLEEFDINQMVKEINQSIDQAGGNGVVEITDDTGERFLKDTVVTIDKRTQMPPIAAEPVQPEVAIEPVTEIDQEPEPQEIMAEEPAVEEVKTIDIKDLNSLDTLDAVLANGQRVKLTFSEQQQEQPVRTEYRNYRTSRLNHNYFAVDFGLNNWLEGGSIPSSESKLYTIKPVGSWYVGGRYFRRVAIGGSMFMDFGASATWYSWKFENRSVRIEDNPEGVAFVEDVDIEGIRSKLSASYLNIEIIPVLDFSYGKSRIDDPDVKRRKYTKHVRPNGIRIGIGGYAGYRLDSWTKNVYRDLNGDEQTDKEGGTFHLNNLRYGVRAQVELDYDFSIFANYDLNTVFMDGKGPELNAISFGITLEL